MPAPTNKKGWFSKIESRAEALKVVKDTSTAFYVLAAIQAALSFWVGFSVLFDAVVYAIGGFFLRRSNSRVAAIVLLLLAIIGAGVTLANKLGENLGGGNNIFLAAIVLWAAIRAVDATFKLRGKFSAEVDAAAPSQTNLTSLVGYPTVHRARDSALGAPLSGSWSELPQVHARPFSAVSRRSCERGLRETFQCPACVIDHPVALIAGNVASPPYE